MASPGASSGIGMEIARQLAAGGYNLVLVARRMEPMEQLAEDMQMARLNASEPSVETMLLQCDLSDKSGPDWVYKEVKQGQVNLDLVVSNAGAVTYGDFLSLGAERTEELLALNVLSHTRLVKNFAQDMVDRKNGGRILLMSSVTAAVPNPGVAVYAASKAYLSSLGQSLHHELAPHGVSVTTAMPGPVRTPFSNDLKRSLCFRLPGYAAPVDKVAKSAINAAHRGRPIVIYGTANRAWAHLVSPLLPLNLRQVVVRMAWAPVGIRKGVKPEAEAGVTAAEPKEEEGEGDPGLADSDQEPIISVDDLEKSLTPPGAAA